jgi:hypothetical protein
VTAHTALESLTITHDETRVFDASSDAAYPSGFTRLVLLLNKWPPVFGGGAPG